jgi:ribonuclease HII
MVRQADSPAVAAADDWIARTGPEQSFWRAGMTMIAGVDEVGRGALAGPLLAASVILPPSCMMPTSDLQPWMARINDSKMVTPRARTELAAFIAEIAQGVGIGIVEANELDAIGVAAANRLAMERAVFALPQPPCVLLLDAAVTDLGLPQVGIIDGDATCLSIAAASIVAKVTRDRMMVDSHQMDSRYGFDQHKGYGTALHLAALRQHGPCALHRRSFAPVAAAMRPFQ